MLKVKDILDFMWKDYITMNPQALRVYKLFLEQGERVENDHIALRTFRRGSLGLESLAQFFKDFGYVEKNQYEFKEKKLMAKHYEHTSQLLPKIFISELKVEELSNTAQNTIDKLIAQVTPEFLSRKDFCWAGRPWNLSYAEYKMLALESEYASWLAAHGFRPNHFTVSVNLLNNYNTINKVNEFLISNGIALNSSGGLIKGSPSDFLEQSSTLAELVEVSFEEGNYQVPGCYYEFALRYPLESGQLYQGFVEKSADKIFESTDLKN